MSPWLAIQVLFASAAWYLAARSVIRAAYFSGEVGDSLAATIRELRDAGRAADIQRLGAALDPSPVAPLLEDDSDSSTVAELLANADHVLAIATPPDRLLRGLATIGTTLGLLAAVAALRTALGQASTAGLEGAAGRALDSAVVGFVTALPCWTAVGLCRAASRRAAIGLERVLLALRSELESGESASLVGAGESHRSNDTVDPVDGQGDAH